MLAGKDNAANAANATTSSLPSSLSLSSVDATAAAAPTSTTVSAAGSAGMIVCLGCFQKVTGNFIEFDGQFFHPHCFQHKSDFYLPSAAPSSLSPDATSSSSSLPVSPTLKQLPPQSPASPVSPTQTSSKPSANPLPASPNVLGLVLPNMPKDALNWSGPASPPGFSQATAVANTLLKQEHDELKLAYDKLVECVQAMLKTTNISASVVTMVEYQEQALALQETQRELDTLKRALANAKDNGSKLMIPTTATLTRSANRSIRLQAELENARLKLLTVSKELLDTKAKLSQETRARQLAEETVKRLSGLTDMEAVTMGFEIDANKSSKSTRSRPRKPFKMSSFDNGLETKQPAARTRSRTSSKELKSTSAGNLLLSSIEKRRSAPPVSTSLDNLITFGIEANGSASLPHHFEIKSSLRPLRCAYCGTLVWATGKKAVTCRGCNIIVHQRCCQFLPPICDGKSAAPAGKSTPVSAVSISPRISSSQRFFETPVVKSAEGIFGVDLAILCSREKRTVPAFVVKCISTIEQSGIKLMTLYRTEASADSVQKIRDFFILGREATLDSDFDDPYVLATALRYYLAELPDPLLTREMYDDFLKTDCIESSEVHVSTLRACVQKLPHNNYDTFRLLLMHLRGAFGNPESSVSIESVAAVFAPLILRPLPESVLSSLLDRQVRIRVTAALLENYLSLFNLKTAAESWRASFEELASDPIGLHVFSRFCQSEYSEENIEFWMAAGEYRRLADPAERLRKAKEIHAKFIRVGAVKEINSSVRIRPVIEAALKDANSCTVELFDEGAVHVYELMSNDTFTRFLRSPTFLELLQD